MAPIAFIDSSGVNTIDATAAVGAIVPSSRIRASLMLRRYSSPATDPRLTQLSDAIAKTHDVKSVAPPALDKRGTAAVYSYRHLLQVLAIKLRQMEGATLEAMKKVNRTTATAEI